MKSRASSGGLVYSTESGRMCPGCRQPVAACRCGEPAVPKGDGVLRVDTSRREVWCSGNPAPLGYDALLVASGARARVPSFPGGHLPGVLTLRTIQDARRVVDFFRAQMRRAVVLGGGALGLEWTHALLERGVHVTLLERAPRFMP